MALDPLFSIACSALSAVVSGALCVLLNPVNASPQCAPVAGGQFRSAAAKHILLAIAHLPFPPLSRLYLGSLCAAA